MALTAALPTQQPTTSPAAHQRATTENEVRGFALYVGLSEDKLNSSDPSIGAVVNEIKRLVAQLAPNAETYAAVALAPEGTGGRDVDVVRLLLQRGLLVQIVQLAGANRHVAHRVQHRLVVLFNQNIARRTRRFQVGV